MKFQQKKELYNNLGWAYKYLENAMEHLKLAKTDTDFDKQKVKEAIKCLEELEKGEL